MQTSAAGEAPPADAVAVAVAAGVVAARVVAAGAVADVAAADVGAEDDDVGLVDVEAGGAAGLLIGDAVDEQAASCRATASRARAPTARIMPHRSTMPRS